MADYATKQAAAPRNCSDVAILTEKVLDEKRAIDHVADDGAGATVIFTGTTRNSFQGKEVIKLEYESYKSLAMATLKDIMRKAHTLAPFSVSNLPFSANASPADSTELTKDRVTRCYIAHRLGEVPVRETSIVIAVSSPHRKEAFVVAEWILEEVKRNVPIWKREFYASGQTVEALDGQAAAQPTNTSHAWSWKANFPSDNSRPA